MPMKVRYTTLDGEIVAESRGGVRKQYVPDPLGGTVALLDGAQTITDSFRYWPYGELASRTGTTPTPFPYVGSRGYYSHSAPPGCHREAAFSRFCGVDPLQWLNNCLGTGSGSRGLSGILIPPHGENLYV